ncbi:MATE family efflux transporter [Neptunomonas sp.]|uniref:MATE family efflux transporter n=1 Tax=Neptunomonas sp. TaxID=1971898 RepID=UPI0025FF519E|nr:MATE family efflux transporter [Neptunomonas sp.]
MATPDLLKDTIRPTLLRMTLPMMVGIVSLMLFNLADIYFVSLLGTAPMAALAFTFPVTFSVVSLAIGFGIGTSATLARLIGQGQQEKAAELATDNLMMTLIVVLCISLVAQLFMAPLFTVMGATAKQLPYILDYMGVWWFGAVFVVTNMVANSALRARGDTKTPALVMGGASALNLILDPLFIFGWGPVPAFGIKGAAMASVISWTCVFVIVIYVLYRRYRLIVLMKPVIGRILGHWLKVMKIGLPAALSNMMTPLAGGVLTAMVAQHGAEAVAAFGVGNRLESLSLLVCLALSMTLPPFVSQNFGAGQIQRVISAYQGAIKFALVWQFLVFLMLLLFQDAIAELFAASELIKGPLIMWLGIVPLGFGMQAVIFLSASTLNALHQPLRAMRISILRLFVFFIPMSWIANELWGLQAMFVAFVLANTAASWIAYRSVSRLLMAKSAVHQ